MENTPTTSTKPESLVFAACPPPVVALGWLIMLQAPPGLGSIGQVLFGFALAFFGSLVSLLALVTSIEAFRSGGAHRGLATFALVGNGLVNLQTATILLWGAAQFLW